MPRILVAEDERDIRELVKITLSFHGFEVVSAGDGAEAVQLARDEQGRFDLILMDVRMPRMTGYEACAELKAMEVTRDIPVVFLSAKGQESEVTAGLEAGAVQYILKPFAPDALVRQVRAVLHAS